MTVARKRAPPPTKRSILVEGITQATARGDWTTVATFAKALEQARIDEEGHAATRAALLLLRWLHATGEAADVAAELAELGPELHAHTIDVEGLAHAFRAIHLIVRRVAFDDSHHAVEIEGVSSEALARARTRTEEERKHERELAKWGASYMGIGRPRRGRPPKKPRATPLPVLGDYRAMSEADFVRELADASIATSMADAPAEVPPDVAARWRGLAPEQAFAELRTHLWREGDLDAIAERLARVFMQAPRFLHRAPPGDLFDRLRAAVRRIRRTKNDRGQLASADDFVRAALIAYGLPQDEATRRVKVLR